jgi:hypothetical protein
MPLAPPVTTATGVNERNWVGAVVLVEVKADSRVRGFAAPAYCFAAARRVKNSLISTVSSNSTQTVTKCRFSVD